MTPTISVIIPVYNAERYLGQCLDSVLSQTFENFEVICVDDGSADSSLEILKKYAVRDPRVKVIEQENLYGGVARNNGMAAARGTYLYFLDADDFIKPGLFETALQAADDYQADIVCFKHIDFYADAHDADPVNLSSARLVSVKEDAGRNFINFLNAPWNKLFRRKFIVDAEIVFQPLKRGNDVYFVNAALVLAERVVLLDDKLVFYRRDHGGNLQAGADYDPVDLVFISEALFKLLADRNIEDTAERFIFNKIVSQCFFILDKTADYDLFTVQAAKFVQKIILKYEIDKKSPDSFYNPSHYKLLAALLESPDHYLFAARKLLESRLTASQKIQVVKKWEFPYNRVKKSMRIILYGAGEMGTDFYRQLSTTGYGRVVLWVDGNYEDCRARGFMVSPPDAITKIEFDYIVICVLQKSFITEIMDFLDKRGITKDKVICARNTMPSI